jgi:hypothetical protein
MVQYSQAMKLQHRLMSLLPLIAGAFLFTGCAAFRTVPPATVPPIISFIAARSGDAARIAVIADVAQHPEHRIAFQAAVVGLDGLLQSTNYDAATFRAVLATLPIKEFEGQNGVLVLTGVLTVFDLVTMFGYEVTTAPAVAAVMQSVRDGIDQGLSTTATKAFVSKTTPNPYAVPVHEPMKPTKTFTL